MMKKKLQNTNRAESKRKFDLIESNPTKMTVIKKKMPLKSELNTQLTDLQAKYESLEIENKQNKETIKNLEENVKSLQQQNMSKPKESCKLSTVSVQTEEIILCHKCDYEADDIYELDAHTYSEHLPESYLTCRYCEYGFDTKKELMIHRKKHHIDRVNTCRDFSNGVCPFVDSVCWYKHSEAVLTIGEVSNTFKCNLCDEGYTSKSEIMYHKKLKHRAPQCKNNIQGTCWFGEEKCWFAHNQIKESDKNENDEENTKNNEIMEKMFKMMETFTERIMKLEERI